MKELGELRYFLGIKVAKFKDGYFICQRKYALDLLNKYGLANCKHIQTSIESNLKLSKKQGKLLDDPTMYRQVWAV